MRYLWRVLILVFAISVSTQSKATEIYENFYNARALGMGNAYSSVVSDHEAVFYNPAALDRVRGFHITALDFDVGTDAANIYSTLQSAMSGNFLQLIQSSYGSTIWATLSDVLAFSMRDLAFVAYDAFNISIATHNPAFTTVDLNSTNDYGFVLGGAIPIIPKMFRVGITGKRITRYGGRFSLGPGTVAGISATYLNSLISNTGTGYGLDAGMLFTVPMGINPTFSFVWHDIGQTKFIPLPGATAPPVMDNEAVLGFSAEIKAPGVTIRPAVDYKHTFQIDYPAGMRTHLGLEFEFPGFTIRGGANQGYYTAGATVNFDFFRLDLATYGVELGTFPGQTEDRRYILSLVLDFSFNPPIGGDDDDNGANGPGGKNGRFRRSSIYQRR